jgi:hypothetical protein
METVSANRGQMIHDLTIIALVAAGFAAIAIGPFVYSLATIAQVIGNV